LEVGVIIFGSVWFLLKKATKLIFFKKTTETEPNWFKPTVSVWFGFLEKQTSLAWFFRFWLGYFPV